jgi:phosphomannomutase
MGIITFEEAKERMPHKKVIIADVDETLCESCQVITPEMAAQVNKLISQGHSFGVTSGTDAKELQRMVSSGVTQEHHILGNSGTNYIRVGDDGSTEQVYTHSLCEEDKMELRNAFEKLITHANLVSMTSKDDQILDRNSQMTLSVIGRNAPLEIKKALDPDGKKRIEWIEFIKQHVDETKYDFKAGGTTSIDVTQKGLNKRTGILKFAKHHGIELQEILYLGDRMYPGGNDFEASKVVDCFAVKNTQDALEKLRILANLKNGTK